MIMSTDISDTYCSTRGSDLVGPFLFFIFAAYEKGCSEYCYTGGSASAGPEC